MLQQHVYEPTLKREVIDLRVIGGNHLPRVSPALLDLPAHVLSALADLDGPPPFTPPMQSRATRFISLRGRGSQRGALAARFNGISRMIVFESLLELHCLHVLLMDTAVVDIWDQPPLINYRNIEGKLTHHTLDYLVTYADGRKVGYAVKPHSKLTDKDGNPSEFSRNMRRVRAEAGHMIRIVHEQSFSRIQLQDARIMHRWNRKPDAEADEVVRRTILRLNGCFPARTVRDLSGLHDRAFGAIVRAVREGVLAKASKKRLDIDSMVRRV